MAWPPRTNGRRSGRVLVQLREAHEAREAHVGETTPVTIGNIASFLGTFAGIIVLIGALLAFDLFLARVDLRESSRHAEAEYQRGLVFLAANEPSSAADRFAAALAIARENKDYALA